MAPAASPSERDTERVGPHPSYIEIAKPYILQSRMQKCLAEIHMSDAKEDSVRLQGVAWIDQVRRALQLPIRTFNTAVIYYHKFRLLHADNEYNWADAAAAALFTACKIEDTLKKSREILCAHWNLKVGPGESLSSDDPRFDNHSKLIIGLERLMLESAGFDFRNRYPQKVMVKLARALRFDAKDEAKTTWNLSIDSYRTFAPLKQSTPTLAIACLELAARLHGKDTAKFVDAGPVRYHKWATSRAEVMETLLDLLDLYTHHRSATSVGPSYTLEHFINIRIGLNQEASAANIPRYSQYKSELAAGAESTNGAKPRNGIDPTSPLTPATPVAVSPGADQAPKSAIGIRGQNGTVRFMLDAARAHDERAEVEKFHKVEEEEYEVEVPNDSRADERDRDRARVGRDLIDSADDWRDASAAVDDNWEDSVVSERRAGYWDRFRQRSEEVSRSQPAAPANEHVHPARRAANFDDFVDKRNVPKQTNDESVAPFDDEKPKDEGHGRRPRKRPRAKKRNKPNDVGDGKDSHRRDPSHERLPRKLSVSPRGEADYERTFDQTGRLTPPDGRRDYGDRRFDGKGGSKRRGKVDHYHESSYYSRKLDGSMSPLDDLHRQLSPPRRRKAAVAQGKNEASSQSIAAREKFRERKEPPHSAAFVHPDRMALVTPEPEPSPPTRPQARSEALPTVEARRKQLASSNHALSANDGHQWSSTSDDKSNGKGRGRGEGKGRNGMGGRGGRGGNRNVYRGGRGRGGSSEE